MGLLKEFREFAMRGNVIDMAVGIIIGGAFGKIVSSLVNDVIMPPIGFLLNNIDFSQLAIVLRGETENAPAVAIRYGAFINTVLDFILIALAIFALIKAINRLRRQKEAPPAEPTTKECPRCYSIIPIRATRCPHCTSELGA